MINLIPPAARKSVVREYWLRVISTWLFLFGTGCLIVSVLLLPTYMTVHGQIVSLDSKVSATSDTATNYDVSAAALRTASTQATFLTSGATTTPFSSYLKILESLTGNGVVLRSVTYARTLGGAGTITITGIASTREILATFRDTLETHPAFTNVILPISALIKDRDLLFTMDLSVATTTL